MTTKYTDGLPAWQGGPELVDRAPWPSKLEYLFKAVSALLASGAWLSLWLGLRSQVVVVTDPVNDLDGGGWAFIGLFLYLPFYCLTALVLVVGAVCLFPRPRTLAPLGAMVGTALGYSVWTLLWRDLWAARPELPEYALAAARLSLASSLAMAIAFTLQRRSLQSPRSGTLNRK